MLGVAVLYQPLHLLPATLAHHRQKRFADEPGQIVVGEYLMVEVYYFPILEVTVRVRRERLKQLVTEEQSRLVQQLGGRRCPAPVKTRYDQLIAHTLRPLKVPTQITIQSQAGGR